MKDNILSYVYGTLFSPIKTFDKIINNSAPKVFESLCIVVIVSFIATLGFFDSDSLLYLGLFIIANIIFGVISWVLVALVINLLGWVFSKKFNINMLLTLTGFSILPWLLVPTISLFKTMGIVGIFLSVFLNILIWIWTIILFILAVSKGSNLSIAKTILLLITPFIGTVVTLTWISGFFSNIIYFLAG